ncbi:hypothetical protein RRG08_037316 [Elysia crispata]|uniref:non-specific serine/threonine protein kinase n=1 Tax=Elysia crispata TaxID=231223 RepID=A0AAE1AG78_9GAST|nr:hypothetical protein RRG08_037316 [Elysia crispata]
MAVAINSLHEAGYIHRDIKPENVLLDRTGHVKLADFGSAGKLNKNKRVCGSMPVGTPDYVAPELLVAMNKPGPGGTSYGPEVDWWSLGVCAYEMLYGATPFTNEHATMVSTYANIMNHKKSLRLPDTGGSVSREAKDLIQKLLTDAHNRLGWEGIKNHSFFDGLDLDCMRSKEAAFIPSVSGLDDTTNFDEVEKVQQQPNVEALKPQADFSGRHLPFVGFTFTKPVRMKTVGPMNRVMTSSLASSPCKSLNSSVSSGLKLSSSEEGNLNNSNILNTAVYLDQTVGEGEEAAFMGLDSRVRHLIEDKDQEIQKLRSLLQAEQDYWRRADSKSVNLMQNLVSMNTELQHVEDELLEVKLEDMKAEITHLETEQEKLSAQLRTKEMQLEKTQCALEQVTQQLQSQQSRLEIERQRSRDDKHKDLVLLELRNETWDQLLEEKQETIVTLTARVKELEDLVEAFRDSEEQQAATVGQLHNKMNASLLDMASLSSNDTDKKQDKTMGRATLELDNLHHSDCPSKRKLTLHVTLKAGQCSFADNKNVTKLQELQNLVDKYSHQAREWRKREEELTAKVSALESDKHVLQQREGMSRKLKESLVDKVSTYQREVSGLQGTIRELQDTMRGYLRTADSKHTLSDKEKELAQAHAAKLLLESQICELKEEAKQARLQVEQQALDVQEVQKTLAVQKRSADEFRQKHEQQLDVAESRVKSLEERLASLIAEKQRLERREATLTTQVESLQGLLDDRTLEVEKLTSRNADIQSHLQQLQARNSELQLSVEKLQRKGAEASDCQAKTKAELTFQVNRLQQQNSELERRVTTDLRERQAAEDRLALVEREKERLGRRIERLEAGQEERRELEAKLEKMGILERENRRLETKVEKLSSLEKDKLNLEEKLEKLNMDLRREKTSLEAITSEKKTLESRLKTLDEKQRSSHNEELAKLKVKVALLDTTEREKARLERELKRMQEEKGKLEEERKAEKMQTKKLEEEKKRICQDAEEEKKRVQDDVAKKVRTAEAKVADLEGEKAVREQHMARLNREIDRLERSIESLVAEKSNIKETAASAASKKSEATSSQQTEEVSRLSAEINRLKLLVDRMETKQAGPGRNSIEGRSNLIDRLQREKAELQRQVEGLEKQQAEGKSLGSRSSRRSSLALLQEGGSLRRVRQEGEEKVKKLEAELSELKSKLQNVEQTHSNQQESQKLIEELKSQVKTQQEEITSLTEQVEHKVRAEKEIQERLEVQTVNVAELRAELEESMKTESALVEQLEKEASNAKQAKDEVEKLKGQLKKSSSAAPASLRKSGESRFEQIQQETKIRGLTEERDRLLIKLSAMSSGAAKAEDNNHSEQLTELQQELEQCRKEIQIRKGASDFCGGDIPAYLRRELEESNLALSEARSLLSASKRIELELRDRIDKLQRIIDNKAVENGRYLQNSQDAIAELRVLKSQHDTLQRQYKVLDDKYQCQQKEKGSNSTETVRLMEEINRKKQQYDMEVKKSEKLTTVCAELEEQLKDMEQIITEFQKREAEWENIKKTYEKAVNEREEELEGATQKLQAVNSQKSGNSEKMRQQLESTKALHKAEVEKLSHKLREEQTRAQKMLEKVAELEQSEKSSSSVFESQMREIENLSKEGMKLKEETARLLSDNCGLRKENLQLRRHLDEAMDKFEMIIGEKVSLENFTEALQGLHFLDKYKFESTIGQQMKLIDYLQDLYVEHTGKKKKSKFFNLGKKEQSTANITTAAIDPRASAISGMAVANQQQPLPPRIQASMTLKVTNSAMHALTNSPASQVAQYAGGSTNSLASLASSHSSQSSCSGDDFDSARDSAYSGSSTMSAARGGQTPHTPGRSHRRRGIAPGAVRYGEPMPTPQRMHHNIPHRFATGLNTRATKCALCLGTVHFVRQASKCQECDMVVHPKCAASVPSTCGLPTEYVRHFALMMSRIYQDTADRESEQDHSAIKMQGWLKVPRVNKPGWENRWCVLEGTWLTLHLQEGDASPVDSFDLSPMDADVSVHSAVTSAELSNTASSDVYYVLRLDQDPLTTCWPGRYLYLMATNFHEKQRWVASFEAIVKSTQCKDELYQNRSQMLTVISLKDSDQREFNCCLVISSQLVLAGTEDGLYAFNPQGLNSKKKQLTQLSGFGSVHQMELAKGVDLILVLTGPERRLVMLENKLVKCRMSQTLGGETTPFSVKTIEGLKCCTIFSVGLWNNASYLVVGTPTKLYVMKYNPSLGTYCVRKEFPSSEPCSCVCIADNCAIVGTERFYRINLEHPSLLDFVDRQDSSLAFAAFGAANHHSYPLAVVRVSPVELPLEFLLCFHEFGVFVNHHGQRSRATDVKWSGLPLAFTFVNPFLYVTYTNTVQATVVPTDRAQAKGRQTVIDIQAPRYLGPAPSPGCVYISSSNATTKITEIIRIQGQEAFGSDLVGEKENIGSLKTSSDKQVSWASPRKMIPRVHQLRKQGSLSSLTSNSSEGTIASIESDV